MSEDFSQPTSANLAEIATSCTCANVRKAARVITQYYDEALQPSGLRATQFTLLVALARAGTLPLTRLAEELVMDRTTLTRNLKPLENAGFIAIDEGSDRRTRMIRPTPQGLHTLALALPAWRQAQDRVMNLLGAQRWHSLYTALEETAATLPHSS